MFVGKLTSYVYYLFYVGMYLTHNKMWEHLSEWLGIWLSTIIFLLTSNIYAELLTKNQPANGLISYWNMIQN